MKYYKPHALKDNILSKQDFVSKKNEAILIWFILYWKIVIIAHKKFLSKL